MHRFLGWVMAGGLLAAVSLDVRNTVIAQPYAYFTWKDAFAALQAASCGYAGDAAFTPRSRPTQGT